MNVCFSNSKESGNITSEIRIGTLFLKFLFGKPKNNRSHSSNILEVDTSSINHSLEAKDFVNLIFTFK